MDTSRHDIALALAKTIDADTAQPSEATAALLKKLPAGWDQFVAALSRRDAASAWAFVMSRGSEHQP